jgi:hypothetical protein
MLAYAEQKNFICAVMEIRNGNFHDLLFAGKPVNQTSGEFDIGHFKS